MIANTNLISCNFTLIPQKTPKLKSSFKTLILNTISSPPIRTKTSKLPFLLQPQNKKTLVFRIQQRLLIQKCYSTLDSQNLEEEEEEEEEEESLTTEEKGSSVMEGEENVNVKEERDWTTSILLFVLWGGLLYYVFNLTPNQTPSRDMYFLEKLLNLKGDDGFVMNQVLVSLWYIMGFWPLVYSMILLPTGRSSKGNVRVWPFLVLSFFGGAYALLPYFVLWNPPPPPVEREELTRWPLNFLESKLTAGITLAAGLGIVVCAASAGIPDWKEFIQYLKESKFIHVTSIDFTLLSAFAPFWVYNDMTARKWYDKGSWLLPVSVVPLVGPALYLLLRPSLLEASPEEK